MENVNKKIVENIQSAIKVKQDMLAEPFLLTIIDDVVEEIVSAYKSDKKVLFCGNGGSAADAQHLAAELLGRFYSDRDPLYAEALHTNTSYLTAVANDYSYEEVFSRMVKAQGRTGDILVGISTSGNSKNVLKAIEEANKIGMITIGMTGVKGGKMKDLCKYLIRIPSDDTPRIQEAHILIGHIICELVEKAMFEK